MPEAHQEWFRVDVQSEMVALRSLELEDVGHLSPHPAEDGAAVLDLVYRAVEVLRAAEARATDIEARAQALAKRTMEELTLAEQRLHAIDAEREAIEASIGVASDGLQNAETALRNSKSRIAVAEAKLTAAERRALEAEARADEAGAALVRIEEAIRIHLLGTRQTDSTKLKAAA